jgi:hypothetical protein
MEKLYLSSEDVDMDQEYGDDRAEDVLVVEDRCIICGFPNEDCVCYDTLYEEEY